MVAVHFTSPDTVERTNMPNNQSVDSLEPKVITRIRRIAQTDFSKRSDRSTEYLNVLDDAGGNAPYVMELVICEAGAHTECFEQTTSDDSMDEETWDTAVENVKSKVKLWQKRFAAGTQKPADVAAFLVDQLRMFADADRVVAFALVLRDIAPYSQIPETLFNDDEDGIKSADNSEKLVQARALLKQGWKMAETIDQSASVLATALNDLSAEERVLLLRFAMTDLHQRYGMGGLGRIISLVS